MSVTDFADPHQIIHIPGRELTGTREAKLAELDIFLAQLEVVMCCLAGRFDRETSTVRRVSLERSIAVSLDNLGDSFR